MKIENDKYYTPIAVANKCWDKVIELIGFALCAEKEFLLIKLMKVKGFILCV